MGQKLRGLVAQGVDGRKKRPLNFTALFPPGSWTFTPTYSGYHKFYLWGCGGRNAASGPAASSGYSEVTMLLTVRDSVTLTVDNQTPTGANLGSTTATFANGRVVTAGSASNNTPGTASGGDVNTAGVAGTGTTGGTAPGSTTLHGGPGGLNTAQGSSPGGGAGQATSVNTVPGGEGLVVVVRVPK